MDDKKSSIITSREFRTEGGRVDVALARHPHTKQIEFWVESDEGANPMDVFHRIFSEYASCTMKHGYSERIMIWQDVQVPANSQVTQEMAQLRFENASTGSTSGLDPDDWF